MFSSQGFTTWVQISAKDYLRPVNAMEDLNTEPVVHPLKSKRNTMLANSLKFLDDNGNRIKCLDVFEPDRISSHS